MELGVLQGSLRKEGTQILAGQLCPDWPFGRFWRVEDLGSYLSTPPPLVCLSVEWAYSIFFLQQSVPSKREMMGERWVGVP